MTRQQLLSFVNALSLEQKECSVSIKDEDSGHSLEVNASMADEEGEFEDILGTEGHPYLC